jgi:hypothetical protein
MHASTITMPNFSAYKHKLKKYQRWPHSQVTLHGVQLKNNFHKMEGGNCLGSRTFLLIRFYINYEVINLSLTMWDDLELRAFPQN